MQEFKLAHKDPFHFVRRALASRHAAHKRSINPSLTSNPGIEPVELNANIVNRLVLLPI